MMNGLQNLPKDLDLSVKIRSIQKVLFVCICVGSFLVEKNHLRKIMHASIVVLTSLEHQDRGLALKSPVVIDNAGLRLFMSFTSFSRLD